MMDSKGTILRSNHGKPVSIIQGKSQIFHSLEKAINEMKQGTKRKIAVPHNEAYGPYRENLVVKIPKSDLKTKPAVGEICELKLDDGSKINMKIIDDKNESYILDGNHPLAGIDLIFNLDIIDRRRATPTEIKTGKIQIDH